MKSVRFDAKMVYMGGRFRSESTGVPKCYRCELTAEQSKNYATEEQIPSSGDSTLREKFVLLYAILKDPLGRFPFKSVVRMCRFPGDADDI